MLIDGKKIAEEIKISLKEEVAKLNKKLRLAVVYVGENLASAKFIERKKKFGLEIGIDLRVYKFPEDISTNQLRRKISEIVHIKQNTGVIIQLPLPSQINTQYILNSVPSEKDPDALSARSLGNFVAGKSLLMPPVVGAIKIIFEKYKIDYKNKYVVLLGAGNLVGKPAALWLLNEKATFTVVRSSTENPEQFLKKADIIISGIGKPQFITGDMVKDGVVVIDAGTSSASIPTSDIRHPEGELSVPCGAGPMSGLVGDTNFDSVSPKASYITPVPGGVGPITVAMLFQNLVEVIKMK